VVLDVASDPPGAEVRQGDRVFGLAPRRLILPRSSAPVHLTFVLDGYEPGAADVVPLADDTLRVKLSPHPKAHTKRPPAATPAPAPERGETLPNPY
jgi:hypothetical protein